MSGPSSARWMLDQESRALLTRLDRLDYFALVEPMVSAAAPAGEARRAVERYLWTGRNHLRTLIRRFLSRLHGMARGGATAEEMQRSFVFLRLKFNNLLADFDTFSDVMTQRSETSVGVWLAGLDVAATDALRLRGVNIETPPVMCYLDRGHGAAIRRARTRLPTGGSNPVAIVRVPRERMVGSGVAASLFHEVGHQAAALLDLVPSYRNALRPRLAPGGANRQAWTLWSRWASEIVADFWAIAQLGVGATLGLLGVVSLPRFFVFRISMDAPHPFPWIRALLSCDIGASLFPDPQWDRLRATWLSFYPVKGLDAERTDLVHRLRDTMPEFVDLLLSYRPPSLGGRTIPEALGSAGRTPARLTALFERWRASPRSFLRAPPSLALAVMGQGRARSALTPEREARLLMGLLRHWALRRSLSEAGSSGRGHACQCRRRRPE